MVFHPKRDKWLIIKDCLLILALLVGAVASLLTMYEPLWQRVLIAGMLVLASIYFLFGSFNLRYIIQDYYLHVASVLSNEKIAIHKITRIRKADDFFSRKGLSLNRIEVVYGEDKVILLFPKDKKGFIDELIAINPHIKVDERLFRTFS
ncbi:hypothetical protein GCM10007140_20400 [Priestia taiwanensis]|uniref:Uncharacterized protein YyaB-like PH domain-containing protein n=2 Tax=Priestia taiwanensis TaxID=1347902 RepID=A0A917ARJ1_9BACI|nr:hypothetical protein GCM10007140_20400 [Priestia taiwanensis]